METKLSNQTPPFLADFDVVICHAVFCSKRDCDCDWLTVSEGGSGSLASETGCLTSRSEFFCFALVVSLCSSTLFFASSPGACLQATSLNVSADDWKRERATTQALPVSSPRTRSSPPAFSIILTNQEPGQIVNMNPNAIRPFCVEMWHEMVWPGLL